jgi:ABC-type amino acid transport substrate-binding protein
MSIVSEDRRGHSGLSVWLIGLAVVLVVALGIWTLAARGGSSRPVLAVGSQRGGTKALMLASGALDGAPYRVEWSEFPAAQNLLEAIGAGAVDLGMASDAPFQFAYQNGQPIKAVAALGPSAPTRIAGRARPARLAAAPCRRSAGQAHRHRARLHRALHPPARARSQRAQAR